MNVYIDIEAIHSQLPWVSSYVASTIKHPGQMKKPETIAKWVEEEKPAAIEEALEKCVFDGAMNQIICIGMAVDDGEVETFVGEERDLLATFFSALPPVQDWTKPTIVGHNVAGFDLRVIKQRSIVLGIRPPDWLPFDAKPWEANKVYDTMIQWDSQNKARLDKLAKAFGIEGKSMDGSMVHQMWKEGKIKEIADYCASDVELTRKVHKRMTYGG